MLTDLRRLGTHCDLLGEGPIWSVLDEAFYWVDIRGKALRSWRPDNDEIRSWAAPSMVGSIAPRTGGGLIVALQDHIAFFNTRSGVFERYRELPGLTHEQRLNDGKCDPDGNFWVGSMNIVTRQPDGMLYRITPTGDASIVLRDLAVPNTLAWDRSGKAMFFSQTRDRRVYRYSFRRGEIRDLSIFHISEAPGAPDGATVDSEDHLWLAEYGNSQILRLDQTGGIATAIRLPCEFPTNCVFGGQDFKDVLITSGSVAVPEDQKASRPAEGGTYVARSSVAGEPPISFPG